MIPRIEYGLFFFGGSILPIGQFSVCRVGFLEVNFSKRFKVS